MSAPETLFQWRRDPNPLALILFDLNEFKEINDTMGPDRRSALKQLDPHQAALRECDMVLTGRRIRCIAAQRQREVPPWRRIKSYRWKRLCDQRLDSDAQASLGLAPYPQLGIDKRRTMRQADIAMYLAAVRLGYAITHRKGFYSQAPHAHGGTATRHR
jgi:GGDEF domain-containing protein